jgi:hypothetical protein
MIKRLVVSALLQTQIARGLKNMGQDIFLKKPLVDLRGTGSFGSLGGLGKKTH